MLESETEPVIVGIGRLRMSLIVFGFSPPRTKMFVETSLMFTVPMVLGCIAAATIPPTVISFRPRRAAARRSTVTFRVRCLVANELVMSPTSLVPFIAFCTAMIPASRALSVFAVT
jgi:hypothetical protein